MTENQNDQQKELEKTKVKNTKEQEKTNVQNTKNLQDREEGKNKDLQDRGEQKQKDLQDREVVKSEKQIKTHKEETGKMFSQTFPENREGLFSCFKKLSPMKKIIPFSAFILFLLSSMLSSCAVVGGIFKTGMGFGIFISCMDCNFSHQHDN